jgi:organic hydroperoxide reductase OsmC/OhrA
MSRQLRLIPKTIEVKSAVGIGQAEDGGFGLVVDLDVKIEGLSQEDAEKVVAAGHKECPYSKAIKGNVDVTIKVVAA